MSLGSVSPQPPGRLTMFEDPLPTVGTRVPCLHVEPCAGRWTTEDWQGRGRPGPPEHDFTIRLQGRTWRGGREKPNVLILLTVKGDQRVDDVQPGAVLASLLLSYLGIYC